MVIAALPKLLNVLLNICDHLTQNVVCVTGKILLTGHDLESKCEVGNALCRQNGLFRMLGCRTKCLTKTIKDMTIVGRQLDIIVSPNLTTPAWTHVLNNLQRGPDTHSATFLVYIKLSGCADIDDDLSMKDLKKRMKAKAVIPVLHFKNAAEMERARNDISICVSADMAFSEKKDSALRILHAITNTFTRIEGPTHPSFVPGKDQAVQRESPVHDCIETQVLAFSSEESNRINGKALYLFSKILNLFPLLNFPLVRSFCLTFDCPKSLLKIYICVGVCSDHYLHCNRHCHIQYNHE